MKCTDCGSDTRVIDSRDSVRSPGERFDATVRRRRCCERCDIRFTTYEIGAERLKALERDELTLTQLGERLKRVEPA